MIKYLIIGLLLFLFSCGDDESTVQSITNFSSELQEGAWLIERIEDNSGNVLIEGKGEPKIILFFEGDSVIKGRLFGNYSLNGDSLNLKLQIDTVRPIFFNEVDILGNYPSRYYEIEELFSSGVNCKLRFYENGWDSQFEVIFNDKKMWLMRY